MQKTNADKKNRTVWALMHVTHEDMGSFEFYLRALGIRPVPLMACTTDIAALNPTEADLVLVMGGPMGVYEACSRKHLTDEIKFIEKRIAAGLPTLGVCLGSQIIANALGAKVYKGPQGKEIGWYPVSINDAGMRTPLRHLDKAETIVAHWHGDTFDLPQGAKLLASSDKYQNQAYSYGENILGIQFHPEVTEVKLERWYQNNKHEIDEVGTSIEALRADAHRNGEILKQQNRIFFTEWLAQVAPHFLEKHPNLMPEEQMALQA